MALNLDQIALSDQIGIMRNRINDLIINLNNGVNTVINVADETSLPTYALRTSDLYIIQTHTKTGTSMIAVAVDGNWLFDSLDIYPFLSVPYKKEITIALGISTNTCVYKDNGTGEWEVADSTDPTKYAQGILSIDDNVVFGGLYYSTSLSLTIGSRYYSDNLGQLTVTPTDNYIGYANTVNTIILNGFGIDYTKLNALETIVDSKVASVVAGTNINVDNTDPTNPVVSAVLTTFPLPKGHINGLLIEQDILDTTSLMTVNTGEARSSDNNNDIDVTSSITKNIKTSWVIGTGNGGLASTVTPVISGHLHCFILSTANGTFVDFGFDTDINATNLLADTAGYQISKYRRVGSILTDSNGDIRPFAAYKISGGGVETIFNTSIEEESGTTSITSGLKSCTVPANTKAKVYFETRVHSSSNFQSRYVINDFNNTSIYFDSLWGADATSKLITYCHVNENSELFRYTSMQSAVTWSWGTIGFIDSRID